MELLHLAPIRNLGLCLMLESLVACIERRDADSVNAILDMFPLADSLKDEPVLISQLVRIGIYGMAVSSLETTMNRMSLADADLAAIQGTLSHILPPAKDTRILDRALLGEEMVSIMCSVDYVYSFGSIFKADALRSYWMPFADIASFGTFSRLVTMVCYARAMESAHSVAQGHGWEESAGFVDRIFSPHLVFRATLATIMLPAMGRAYEAEWRVRTYLDLAQTAIAVERFRLGHGRLPRQLGELVPTYIEEIPLDLWSNSKPLSYRMWDTGEFVVYSYGRDRHDDLGDEGSEKDAPKDFTFAVAPPEIRGRPQVAPE
jgi:hypothetical protein